MIRCEVCKHEEYEGTLYCSECGNQLWEGSARPESDDALPITQRFTSADLSSPRDEAQAQPGRAPSVGSADPSQIVLRLTSDDQALYLAGSDEYRIGRGDPRQPVRPDIDLGPYRALELGVSRIHAVIKCSGSTVTLTDLGSTNGTTVNGLTLAPNQPQIVRDGDELRLGKLALRIFFNLG